MTLIRVGLENLHFVQLGLYGFHDVDLIDLVKLTDEFEHLRRKTANLDINIHLFMDDFLINKSLFNQRRFAGLSFFELSEPRS
jgi:hypothetical protein